EGKGKVVGESGGRTARGIVVVSRRGEATIDVEVPKGLDSDGACGPEVGSGDCACGTNTAGDECVCGIKA
ncbi:hypothetical protein Dimus_035881, partial [Dionaea muscipula]